MRRRRVAASRGSPSGALALGGGALALVALRSRWPSAPPSSRRRSFAASARPRDRALARYIEEQCPALEDRLATAVEIAGDADLPPAAAFAAPCWPMPRARSAKRRSTTSSRASGCGVPACSLPSATFAVLVAAALWIEPGRQALRVRGALRHPRPAGTAGLTGRCARQARRAVRDSRADNGRAGGHRAGAHRHNRRPAAHRPHAGRRGVRSFAWRFDGVPASFTYSVSAAGRTSETYTVTALDPPRVARIDLRYEFPRYTRLPPRDEEDGGDIYAPNGTRVTLSIRASTGATAGALALGRWPARAAAARIRRHASRRRFRSRPTARTASRSTDRDGLASDGDTEYFIRVLDDRPPDVRILRPAGDRQVTPLEEVTIEARADDDYGVGASSSSTACAAAARRRCRLQGERAPLSVTGRHTLFLEELGVQPGDFVTYYARARDVARGRRVDRGAQRHLLPRGEAVRGGVRAGAEPGWRRERQRSLDDLVTAQKDIVVATWKLDRRAGGGPIGPGRAGDRPCAGRAEGNGPSARPRRCATRGAARASCRATRSAPRPMTR